MCERAAYKNSAKSDMEYIRSKNNDNLFFKNFYILII